MKNSNKKTLFILGGHGVGLIAANIALETNKYDQIFFLNDYVPKNSYLGKYKNKFKVIGKTDLIKKLIINKNNFFFNAIIDYKNKNSDRNSLFYKFPKKKFISLIHPSSFFFKGSVKLKNNILISPSVNISTDVSLGNNTFIMMNAFIGHNSSIGDGTFIAANATVGGSVKIGKNCFVGLNSTIVENIKMGDKSFLGAHSILRNHLKKNTYFKIKL